MDEYNLAEAILNYEMLSPEELSDKALHNYQKIPFTELAGIGGVIAELIPQFRTITETISIDGTGLFRPIDPKTGKFLKDLQYKSHQIDDAYVGSLYHRSIHQVDQAAFKKVESLEKVTKTVAAINPAVLMTAITIAAMSKKLDRIEETQQKMLQFLESDKRTAQEGTLNYLLEVFSNYKYNWNSDLYRKNAHLKTQDVKQEAEHNLLFYQKQINELLDKRKVIASRLDVNRGMNKLIEHFADYRLSLYLYSFASFLEIILLENYKKDFLEAIISKIRDFAYSYLELYSKCYVLLSDSVKRTIETGAMKAIAAAAKGTGKFINKIPVVERGQLDENLIKAGEKLNDYKDESGEALLQHFTLMRDSSITQFADLIETIKTLHNEEPEILFDSENLYVKAIA